MKPKEKDLKIPLKIKKTIFDFNRELKNKLGNNLISVNLFGSYARGDWNKLSDIDILVIVKNKTGNTSKIIYGIITNILLKNDIYLSVKIFDLEKYKLLNKFSTLFIKQFNKDSVTVG